MSVRGIDRLIFPNHQDFNGTVVFTIHGWDNREVVSDTNGISVASRAVSPIAFTDPGRSVPIAIHLSQSWQASWL
jgi:hypothetical protein